VRVFDGTTLELKASIDLSTGGGAGRDLAIDPVTGFLWIKDGANTLAVLDQQYNTILTFDVGVPSCSSCTNNGWGGMDFSDGPDRHLYISGSWNSGGFNRLLKLDPVTLNTVAWIDLGTFQPSGLAVAPGPFGLDQRVYVTEWGGAGRIAVFDLGLTGLGFVSSFPGAGSHISHICGDSSGALLVGIPGNGPFLSDASQTAWAQLHACPQWAAYGSVAMTRRPYGLLVAGPDVCFLGVGKFRVFGFGVSRVLDSTAGGLLSPSVDGLEILD